MSDDRDKPGRRPGSVMGDDDRALVGRKHRRPAPARGVPVLEPSAADLEQLAEQDNVGIADAGNDLPADAELTAPSELVMADPVARELWNHIDRVARRGVRRHRNTADALLAAAAGKGDDKLCVRVAALEKRMKWWQGLAMSALVAAAGSVFAIARGLFERGEKEGRAEIRLQVVEQQGERNRVDISMIRDRLEDRSGHRSRTEPDRPAIVWPPAPVNPSPKGTAP